MTKHVDPHAARRRGLILARAEGNPVQLVEQLNRAFNEFKAENEAKFADVVRTEKMARIEASITDITRALEEANARMESIRAGAGGDGRQVSAEVREHRAAFETFFRRGEAENALRALEVKAALTTQSNPDGGYLVPETMDSEITRVLGTVSAMRGLARVVSLGTSTFKKLHNAAGTGSGWVGEEASRQETSGPGLKELEFPTGEIYANPAATQSFLDDASVDIESWLAGEVSIEFAEQEGAAFISGDGVNKPRGILKYGTVANASYAWGSLGFVVTGGAAGFASSNPADALIDLHFALKAGYRNNATWLVSDAVMGTIRKMKDGQGNYLWAPPTGPDMPATILGKPVATDDNMPALGSNTFPVAFGDFQRGYLILDRTGVRVLRDPYTNKPYVQFYTTKRVGGGVQDFAAIKLLKCSA